MVRLRHELTTTSSTTAHRRRGPRRRWIGLPYVLPALAVYGMFVLFPVVKAVQYSFHDWDGVNAPVWTGLANYREAFTTPLLRSSILNAFKLIVFFSFVPVAAGLGLTALISRSIKRGIAGYRLVFFIPYVIPMTATGILWRWMYNPNGVVNQVFENVGLARFTRAWLGDFDVALIAVGLIGSWTLSGFCMMLFLAGVQRIDGSLYEAAQLDGAGGWWQFRAVTLPGLRREISVALVVTIIAALATFDIVYVATNGGPANTTMVPSLLVYRLAFSQQQVGLAAALSVILTVLVVAVVATVRGATRERT